MMSRRWQRWAFLALMMAVAVGATAWGAEVGEKKWPGAEGYWLPEAASTYAEEVDGLFNGILYLTGVVFVITELLLIIFLIKYRKKEGQKSVYSHGNHTLELVWTITPAIILAIIAFIQKDAWDKIKKPAQFPSGPEVVQVQNFAQQFSWNFRYPGIDGKWGTKDDILSAKKLYVPVNKPVVIEQTSNDVIHSFFLPYHRLKQDAVPGMHIKVWFQSTKSTKDMQKTRPTFKHPDTGVETPWNFEIVCAELCGLQHAQMKGQMFVLDQAEYDEWYKKESEGWASGDREYESDIWKRWKVNAEGQRVYKLQQVEAKK